MLQSLAIHLLPNKALISNKLAKQLQLNLNDKMMMYFVQNPPRARMFEIGGIYETGTYKVR